MVLLRANEIIAAGGDVGRAGGGVEFGLFLDSVLGVASQQIAIGMDFFALGLVAGNSPAMPALTRWTRLALAGLCVGMNVMEAADIGAIFSVLIAAFVFQGDKRRGCSTG